MVIVYMNGRISITALCTWMPFRQGTSKTMIVLLMSIDGAQLYQSKQSGCWIYIWVILDFAPDLHYKKLCVFLGGIIPGPTLVPLDVISIVQLKVIERMGETSTLPSPTDSRWSPPGLHKSMWTPSGKDLNLQFCIKSIWNPSGVHLISGVFEVHLSIALHFLNQPTQTLC